MENYPIEALIRYIKTEIDTIALDYDGVIVNSVVESKKIVIKTAGQYGQLVKMTDFKDYSGMSWEEMFPKLGEKLNWTPELISEISKESTLRALNKKFDVPDFLLVRIQELKDVGLKIGVVTNRTMSSLKTSASLAGINLEEVFDFVATSDNLAHKKPSPGVWDDLYNSKQINFIGKVLFIGDSRIDFLTTQHKKFPVLFFGVNNQNEFIGCQLSEIKIFKETVAALNFILTCKEKVKSPELSII